MKSAAGVTTSTLGASASVSIAPTLAAVAPTQNYTLAGFEKLWKSQTTGRGDVPNLMEPFGLT